MAPSPADAFFLESFEEIWLHLTLWATATACAVFFIAGVWASRVGKTRYMWVWTPLSFLIVGGVTAFVQAAIVASLIAAIYRSVPYAVGLDTAAGLGVGIGIVFLYFHFGRSDFIHR